MGARAGRPESRRTRQPVCTSPARGVAATATLHDMGPVGHYMLRYLGAWNDFAISRSLALLDPS